MGWKVGGSRGNPPHVGPSVSCHWRNARRVVVTDGTSGAWMTPLTFSPLLPLLLLSSSSLSFCVFLLRQSPPRACRGSLVQMEFPPPPIFKMRAESERGRQIFRAEVVFIYLFSTCHSHSSVLWARQGGR